MESNDPAALEPYAEHGWVVTRGVAPWIGRRGTHMVYARPAGELVRMLQHRTNPRLAAGTSSATTNDEGTTA